MSESNKNIGSTLCPFCDSNLEPMGVSILSCKQCESGYCIAQSDKMTIESFSTNKYSIQMYKSSNSTLTRCYYIDDRSTLFWLKEEIKYTGYSLQNLDNKIDSLIALA